MLSNVVYLIIDIDLLTAVGMTPCGISTIHIYTQTIHRTTQLTTYVGRLPGIRTRGGHTKINDELSKNYRLGPSLVFASYTVAFAIQLRKIHGKTLVRVAEECQLAR